MSTLPPDLREPVEHLLEGPPAQVLAQGRSVLLLQALENPVTSVLQAERAPFYITLLHTMVLLRRRHELEPLHDNLFRQVRGALGPDYAPDAFAQDVAQLEEWGALHRAIEPARVRSYKDNRRERHRYRLTADALAMVEWLEGRLRERLTGRVRDGRNLLQDVAARLAELERLLKQHRKRSSEAERGEAERGDAEREPAERDEDAPRRSVHLLLSVDDAVDALSETLLGFRASMIAFAGRPYDLPTLVSVLGFLETYVEVYLRRIQELREAIRGRTKTLGAPRFREALADLRSAYDEEGRHLPGAFGGGGRVRPSGEMLDATIAFFADEGQLDRLCAGVDEGARQVLRKMRRRLRELERRSQRVRDLRACARAVARGEIEGAPLVRGLIASAHVALGSRGARTPERMAPPLPRKHQAARAPRRAGRPLRPKRATAAEVRALRAARLAALGRFLRELAGDGPARLSSLAGSGPIAPRAWLDVAKAHHLGAGKDLERVGYRLSPEDGRAVLSEGTEHLDAPDTRIERRS